jgi:hypothetical protein
MAMDMAQVRTLAAVATTADELKRAIARLRVEVEDARRAGASWDTIGAMVGTTGEAARQKFGPKKPVAPKHFESRDGGLFEVEVAA